MDTIETFFDIYSKGEFRTILEFHASMPEKLKLLQEKNTVKRVEKRFYELYPKTERKTQSIAFVIVPGGEAVISKSGKTDYFLFHIPEAATKTRKGTARDAYFFDYVVAHEIGEIINLENLLIHEPYSEEFANCVAREITIGCNLKQYQSLYEAVEENMKEFPLRNENHPNVLTFKELGFNTSQSVVLAYTIRSLPEYSKKCHMPQWDWESFYRNINNIRIGGK